MDNPPDNLWYWSTIAARTLIVLLALVIGLRFLGKRQIGQMNIYDLALIMLLANAVQNAMTNGSGFIGVGIFSAGSLFLAGWLISRIFVRMPTLQTTILGTSTLLIQNGLLIKDNLRREHVSEDELIATIRQHGMEHPSQVQTALLEVDGTISIIPIETTHHTSNQPAKRSRRRSDSSRTVLPETPVVGDENIDSKTEISDPVGNDHGKETL